jgi:hypothetical protein
MEEGLFLLALVLVFALKDFMWSFLLAFFLWIGRKCLPDKAGRILFGRYWHKDAAGHSK